MIISQYIPTNYGRITESGELFYYAYTERGVEELAANKKIEAKPIDYFGNVFIVTDGFVAFQNLKMWLYYNNRRSHACDLGIDSIKLMCSAKRKLRVQPRDKSPEYEIEISTGTILGVKDGLPIEVAFKLAKPN